jgi:hypothetical protein
MRRKGLVVDTDLYSSTRASCPRCARCTVQSTCERKANVCDLLCEEEEGGGASPAIEEMPKNQFQREANSLYLTLLGKRRGSLHGERVREE